MKKFIVLIFVIVLMSGCSFMDRAPKDEVIKFLNNYKTNSESVVNELDEYLAKQDLDKDTVKDYKELYLRQYTNLEYEIKDQRINGDDAFVDVQIKVYDYYKTSKETGDYLSENKKDFITPDGDVDFFKYFSYKVDKMLDTTDTVEYLITINLKKDSEKWVVEPLTSTELEKLHGVYEY